MSVEFRDRTENVDARAAVVPPAIGAWDLPSAQIFIYCFPGTRAADEEARFAAASVEERRAALKTVIVYALTGTVSANTQAVFEATQAGAELIVVDLENNSGGITVPARLTMTNDALDSSPRWADSDTQNSANELQIVGQLVGQEQTLVVRSKFNYSTTPTLYANASYVDDTYQETRTSVPVMYGPGLYGFAWGPWTRVPDEGG